MAYYNLPADCPKVVKDMIESEVGMRYNLIIFSTESLKLAYDYLSAAKMYSVLRKQLEMEIRARELARSKPKNTYKESGLELWFKPLWLAVQALYDKGDKSLSDPDVKLNLSRIKSEWAYNCNGRQI